MNILIVSATEFEIKPLLGFLGINTPITGLNKATSNFENFDLNVLITGIGMVNTALMVGRHSLEHYDLVINAGVCGAFNKSLELGEVVHITEDILSEMGAEDGGQFLRYDQLNLPGEHIFTGIYKDFYAMLEPLKKLKGITVNTIHGNDESIEKVKQLYKPDVETMEGAAFFAATHSAVKNSIQIRAISNYVEKRDRSKWQMALAIQNLNEFLIKFVSTL